MGNAAIGYINLADAGTISASQQVLQMPALNMLTPHVEQRFRSPYNSVFFVLDLGTVMAFDTVLLRGMTITNTALAHIRLSTTDPSGAAGDAYSSATIAPASRYMDPDYGAMCLALPAPVNARYVRVDIENAGRDYIEVGRLVVMLREAFEINFSYGWQIQWVDRSARQKSRGGQTLVWLDNKYRTVTLPFEFVSEEQRYGLIEKIDRINGAHTDLLMIIDTDSDNLARDTIFGLATDVTPVVQSVFERFSKTYTIEERL